MNRSVKLLISSGIVVILGLFIAWPQYRVWQQGLEGKARLRRAEQERKIFIEQARAEKEAASLRAEAITIMGEAAQKYPEYRLQEFMGQMGEALQNGDIEKIIFVPTEANIPVVKANPDRD